MRENVSESQSNAHLTRFYKGFVAVVKRLCYYKTVKDFDLLRALKSYKPFDEKEAEHLRNVLSFLAANDNAYSRSNFVGHITGSGFLMNTNLTKILMTHHKSLGRWLQFGGHSDGDTNTMRVAMRETTEESGIKNFKPLGKGIIDIDVHPIAYREDKQEPAHFHYDIRFIFTTNEDKFQISDESDDLRWFTMEEFKKMGGREEQQRLIKKWEQLQKEKTLGIDI